MGRRRRPTINIDIDRNEQPLYLCCEHTDPTKTRDTRQMMRVWVSWCHLKCEHKCKEFSTISEEEITRNIKLLVERHGDKYLGDIKSFDLNKKIYKKCVLCANDCKKEGVGILISCVDFKSSGRKRVTKTLEKEAEKILDNSENLTDIVEEIIPEEKPKKRGRGRPKKKVEKVEESKPKKSTRKETKKKKKKKTVKKTVKKKVIKKKTTKPKKTEGKKNVKKQRGRKPTKKTTRKTENKKTTRKKKTDSQKVSLKSKKKRGKEKLPQLVKGRVKSIRKARGKNLYRLTLNDGQKFEPTGPRSSINKYLETIRDLWGNDLIKCNAVITMDGKKVKDIEIQQ